jgi:UDP-glucose 4-epimerase
MYNVLITGGNGYIGSVLQYHLKHYYAHLIKTVVSYDVTNGYDILNIDQLTSCLIKHNIYIVIHLAACSSVTECEGNKRKAFLINVKGTKNVLEAMHRTKCNHLIYASSSAVYGNTKEDFLNENKRGCTPCSMYGFTKLSGEHVLFNDSVKYPERTTIIFRMFNVIGSCKEDQTKKTGNYGNDRLITALYNGKVYIYGTDYPTTDGTCLRDYVSVNDIAKAYSKAIEKIIYEPTSIQGCHVFNLCTSKPVSVLDIVQEWNRIQEINQRNPCEVVLADRRRGDPTTVYGDNTKAATYLNWKPMDNYISTIIDMNI